MSLLHFNYQIGAVLQLFTWGICFFIIKSPSDRRLRAKATRGVGAVHEGAAGSARDVGTSASALGLSTTGDAPAAGA